jgi:hypothetical protein
MSEEPIALLRAARPAVRNVSKGSNQPFSGPVRFDRVELKKILSIYGRMVAAGEWRDYAIDFLDERAVFSVYRRTSEMPLFRIEKDPGLRNRQGQYSVIDAAGHVLKRGHDLGQVLLILERKLMRALAAAQ